MTVTIVAFVATIHLSSIQNIATKNAMLCYSTVSVPPPKSKPTSWSPQNTIRLSALSNQIRVMKINMLIALIVKKQPLTNVQSMTQTLHSIFNADYISASSQLYFRLLRNHSESITSAICSVKVCILLSKYVKFSSLNKSQSYCT